MTARHNASRTANGASRGHPTDEVATKIVGIWDEPVSPVTRDGSGQTRRLRPPPPLRRRSATPPLIGRLHGVRVD